MQISLQLYIQSFKDLVVSSEVDDDRCVSEQILEIEVQIPAEPNSVLLVLGDDGSARLHKRAEYETAKSLIIHGLFISASHQPYIKVRSNNVRTLP